MASGSRVEDAELGVFERAETVLTDGEVLRHDFWTGTIPLAGLEVMINGVHPEEVRAALPRLREVAGRVPELTLLACDAVARAFAHEPGEDGPGEADFTEARADFALQTVEVGPGGAIVLHMEDRCGEHFMEGYWPAVHLDASDAVTDVTVEA